MKLPNTPPLPQTPIDLGDNLRLRFAVPDDFDAWVDFNERMREYDPSSNRVGVWAHELMSGRHPTTRAGDFTVVEDAGTGKIVSSLCLIPQTWSYGGIPFGCGRIEQVGTDPALPAARPHSQANGRHPRAQRFQRRADTSHHRHSLVLPPIWL